MSKGAPAGRYASAPGIDNQLGGGVQLPATPAAPIPQPSDLSDLKYWLDSNQGTPTTTDNANLSSWSPRAGNVTDPLTQGTANNQLVYDAIKGAVCNSVTKNLTTKGWFEFPASFSLDRRSFTFAMVVEAYHCWAGGAGNNVFVTNSTSDQLNLFLTDSTGRLSAYDGSSTKAGGSTAVPTINRCLIGWIGDAAETRFWVNGSKTTGAALSAGSATLTRLFGYDASNQPVFWACTDVIVRTVPTTDDDWNLVLLEYAARARGVQTDSTRSIFFVGDSISQGYGTTCNRAWPEGLSIPSNTRAYGFCYSGATALALNTDRPTLMDPLAQAGDAATVFAGTNDVSLGQTGATAAARVDTLCTGIQGLGVVVAVYPPLPRGNGAIAGEYEILRDTINSDYATYADYDVDLITLSPAAFGPTWGTNGMTDDGVHPNDAGNAVIVTDSQPTIDLMLP